MRALLAAILLGLGPAARAAKTLVVDKNGGDFSTLAEANKEAQPGDTVFLRAISEPLDGLQAGVIYATESKAPQSLALKDCRGFTLSGFRFKSLSLENCEKVSIVKCRVEGGGVSIKTSKDVSIKECAFAAPDEDAAPARVAVEKSDRVSVEGSLIQASRVGVLLLDAGDASVKGNTITGARYQGPPLDPNDLADAHDALTSAEAILVQCAPTMMEAWDKRGAKPAEISDNVVAFNERGIIVDRCAKGNDALKVRRNLFHANGGLDYVAVVKKYQQANFSYVLEDVLAKGRMADGGNKLLDPLFADAGKGNFSLTPESPAARMSASGGSIGAAAAIASAGRLSADKPKAAPAPAPAPAGGELAQFLAKDSVMVDAPQMAADASWKRGEVFERCKALMTPTADIALRGALLAKVKALPYKGGRVADAMRKDPALKSAVENASEEASMDAHSFAVTPDFKHCRATAVFENKFSFLAK
jgi:hypothetical protein